MRNKIETLHKDDTSISESYSDVDNFLLPSQWMSELNDCLDEELSPFIKDLDHIIELLEDVDELVTFKLEKMLKSIKEKDKTFLYKMGVNEENDFTGCCWQTGVMRGNYELYGHYLSLDAMRRELNTHHWCYVACTVRNDVNESQVCIECLAIGERKDTYRFMLNALIEFSPGLVPTEVFVVSSDAFLDQAFISEFFPRANFLVYDMINAKDSATFDSALNQIQQLHTGDTSLNSYFAKKGQVRSTFAQYERETFLGNMELLGSTMSEQNNSSVLAFIEDLTSSSTLVEMVTSLLRRQHMKEVKTNARLQNQELFMNSIARVASEPWKKEAASKLTQYSYQKYVLKVESSKDYCVYESNGLYLVRRINSDAPPRNFPTENARCMCSFRIAFMMPCDHEIALLRFRGKPIFNIGNGNFHKRHHQRTGCYVSCNMPDIADALDLQDFEVSNTVQDGYSEYSDDDEPKVDDSTFVATYFVSNRVTKVTYGDIMNSCTEVGNILMKLKSNELAQMYLGFNAKMIDLFHDKKGADNSWNIAEISKYCSSFLNCMSESLTGSKILSKKRKKSGVEKLSQKSLSHLPKEKSCSLCKENFSTGHHTARNCPNMKPSSKEG